LVSHRAKALQGNPEFTQIFGTNNRALFNCQNDILINEVIKKFTPNPILVIIQAAQQSSKQELALPTDAYVEVQEVHDVSFERVSGDYLLEIDRSGHKFNDRF
jgi:hypothetical protein